MYTQPCVRYWSGSSLTLSADPDQRQYSWRLRMTTVDPVCSDVLWPADIPARAANDTERAHIEFHVIECVIQTHILLNRRHERVLRGISPIFINFWVIACLSVIWMHWYKKEKKWAKRLPDFNVKISKAAAEWHADSRCNWLYITNVVLV